jgi:hypothetical protein
MARSISMARSKLRLEFRKSAAAPTSFSALTWSCIRAISGDTTMATPGRSSAGIW